MATIANCDRCTSMTAAYSLNNMTNGDTVWLCTDCLLQTAADLFEAVHGPLDDIGQTSDTIDEALVASELNVTGRGDTPPPRVDPPDTPGDDAAADGGDVGADGVSDGTDAAPPPAAAPKRGRRVSA